jgi:glycerophosphoryl diester phosphodiesterase
MNQPKPSKLSAWPYPTLFAHRGGGHLAPENTLAAMQCGVSHGYSAVEFDVKLSLDSIAYLMHDDTLERTAHTRARSRDCNMAELETLDAGTWFDEKYKVGKFRGEKIPRFSAIAKYLHGGGVMANVEIKPCPGREAETGIQIGELCAELWQDRLVKPLLSSFSVTALRAARAAAPDLPMGLLVERAPEETYALLEELRCVSIHTHFSTVNADIVRAFHHEGYRVMTYTANDVDVVAQLLDIGVDGIFTDNLEMVARRFPHQLSNAGKPMYSQPEVVPGDWAPVIPPMP